MDNSAGLNLVVFGSSKRKEALLTWSFPEVQVLRNCLGVVLSAVFSCMCLDRCLLSAVYVRNQNSGVLRDTFCVGFCLEARILIA